MPKLDTSFLFAATSKRDSHHSEAAGLFAGLDGRELLTTNHVLGESWTLARRRRGIDTALAFDADFEAAGFQTLPA